MIKSSYRRQLRNRGLCEEIFESHDEKPTNSFLYSLVMDTYTGGSYSTAPFLDMPLNHKVFLAQFDAIKKIAANESCVIVGRCADYALADEPHCLNIFIRSNMDDRIKRISERLNVPENKAKDIIKKKIKSAQAITITTPVKNGETQEAMICARTQARYQLRTQLSLYLNTGNA